MDRNSRIIAVAAVGALIVIAVSTAARIAMRRAAEARAEDVPIEEEAPAEAIARWRIPEPEGLADEIRTHGWTSEDGSSELCVRGTTIVERRGDEVQVTSFSVASEEGDSLSVLATAPDGSAQAGEIRLVREAGGLRLESGVFRLSGAYLQHEVAARVRIEGVPERYLELVGDWQGFAHGVEAYCETWVPGALTATFAPDVVLNADTGIVTATLVCDDAASTAFTVSWDGATFEVSGDGR